MIYLYGTRMCHSTRIMPLLALLLISSLSYAQSDLTHHIDVFNNGHSVIYTNTSYEILRCQISTKIDESLPFGTLGERKNITLRGHQSYTYHRFPTEQIIYCESLVEETDNARLDD